MTDSTAGGGACRSAFVGVEREARIEDVATPSPGPGQVVIKIGGAGVYHSDLHVMEEGVGGGVRH